MNEDVFGIDDIIEFPETGELFQILVMGRDGFPECYRMRESLKDPWVNHLPKSGRSWVDGPL